MLSTTSYKSKIFKIKNLLYKYVSFILIHLIGNIFKLAIVTLIRQR